MNFLVIILLVSIINLVKSDDNVAMESETSYQVHLTPDFPKKIEPNIQNYNVVSAQSNLRSSRPLKENPNSRLPDFPTNNNPPPSPNNLNKKSKNEEQIADNVGASAQQVILLEPQQLYQSEHDVNYQAGAYSDNPTHYTYQKGYESGYSNLVEHLSENDEDYKAAIQQGSMGDIKRIVPKSTVSFKMYHNDKSTRGKTGKLKSGFHSNVFHEVSEVAQEQTDDASKQHQAHESDPSIETQHTSAYPVINSPTQIPYSADSTAQSLPNNYFQQAKPVGLSNYLSKTAGNFRIVAANPNYEMHRHKINSQAELQKNALQSEGFAHQANFLKHVQALHQFENSLSESLPQPAKVVDPQQNVHFEEITEQPKKFNHNYHQEFKHTPKKNPKIFKGKKQRRQHKKKIGNRNPHQIQGQHEIVQSLHEDQILHKAPAVADSFGIPIKQELNQQHEGQILLKAPAVADSFGIPIKQELNQQHAIHSVPFSNGVPLTPEDYMAKYQRDVALIQNTWNTFRQTNHFKAKDNKNLNSPILSKPADSFHFEINPLIDVGTNLGQDNFDHQKALEGSTTFDLNHAIGIVKDGKNPTADAITASNVANGIKLSTFDKHTFPYSFPTTQKNPLTISQNLFHDSLSSNSDLSQSSFTSTIPDNKYFYEFQNLPELKGKNKQLAQIVGSDFPDHLFPLSHHLKSQTPMKGFPSGNLNLFSSKLKPVRDYNFQQKKNNALVLQNQQLVPLSNIDWDSKSTKLGKSKKILIHSELIPLMNEPDKKIIPILMKKRKNRSYKEGNGVYLRLIKKNRRDKLANESDFDLMPVDSKKVNKYNKENDRKKEYPVSAFYKVDKNLRKSDNVGS